MQCSGLSIKFDPLACWLLTIPKKHYSGHLKATQEDGDQRTWKRDVKKETEQQVRFLVQPSVLWCCWPEDRKVIRTVKVLPRKFPPKSLILQTGVTQLGVIRKNWPVKQEPSVCGGRWRRQQKTARQRQLVCGLFHWQRQGISQVTFVTNNL